METTGTEAGQALIDRYEQRVRNAEEVTHRAQEAQTEAEKRLQVVREGLFQAELRAMQAEEELRMVHEEAGDFHWEPSVALAS